MKNSVLVGILSVFMILIVQSHQEKVYFKSYISKYKTESGFYNINYDGGSCEMSLGLIPEYDVRSLWTEPYYSPNFTLIASTTSFTGQAFVKVDNDRNGKYIMAFNNGTQTCEGSISASKEAYNAATNTVSLTIKYDRGASINHKGVSTFGTRLKDGFKVTSKGTEPITISYSIDAGNSFKSEVIKPSGSSTIQVGGCVAVCNEMHLRCDNKNGCVVDVSYAKIAGVQRNMVNLFVILLSFAVFTIWN